MNRKGSILDLFLFASIGIIVVVFFGILLYFTNTVSDALQTIPNPSSNPLNISVSNAASSTFGNLSTGASFLTTLAFIIIFGMALLVFITNFFAKSHPVFYGVYVLITIIGIVFAVFVSNAYETLLTGNTLSSTFDDFTAANFILAYLPLWVAVIGIFGAIFLFINFPRDTGLGGSRL